MKGRYIKKSFHSQLLSYLIITLLISLFTHLTVLYGMEYIKTPVFYSSDYDAHNKLLASLPKEDETYNEYKIQIAFSTNYPGFSDHGHSGLEKTALIIDAETNELIASNDFTLPGNKLLRKFKEDPHLYINLIPDKYKNDQTEKINYFRYENIKISKPFNMSGKNVRLLTVMRVNYYSYFLKYILPIDIIMIVTSISLSAVLTYQKKTKEYEDDYRRNIINSLSHDLKTPLTIISGCAESLKENINPDKREFYENTILENAKYSEIIINDALELSRSEKGFVKPEFSELEVNELFREIWKKYELTAKEKNIVFTIAGSKVLKCDKKLITQMFENIISNAVKYTDNNGTIDVSVKDQIISVSNTFSGKIDTDIKKLTEPFTRGTKERAGRNGSGLGLAIAKNIADAHKYKLSVDVKEKRFIIKIKT